MAVKYVESIIHFPDVDKIDWISNNFINSRGGSFVAPVTDTVKEFMPVFRGNVKDRMFKPCIANDPAILVCRKIFIDNGVRYGVIDCTIRTAKCTSLPYILSVNKTYTITYTGNDMYPEVTVTESNTGKLFRIIDIDTRENMFKYIDA